MAYFKNPRIGGMVYNITHFLALPIILGLGSVYSGDILSQQIALIWVSHIAFDRMLGWGLKFDNSFCNTDMGLKELPIDTAILK